ncbi:MAG: sigma 54-interacting transcriptional regulator, partial [Anaerovorax sp.]
ARTNLHGIGFKAKYSFSDIKGDSSPIKKALSIAEYYSKCDGTILILGESGTGKELFAQSIHQASDRSKESFVAVNFGAISENLVESELFGYEEGAFTGALKGGKKGLFRIAHKGTIFLDEIGDASLSVQTRLLRVLEEREVTPVGSSRTIPIDVRIICATNKNLEELVAQGKFRDDLYYRIKVLVFTIPSLRERRSDIPIIINSILSTNKNPSYFTKIPNHILTKLMQYNWPGNIRELKSLIQNIAMFFNHNDALEHDGKDIFIDDIIDGFLIQKDLPVTSSSLVASLDHESFAILKEINKLNANGIIAGRYSLSRNINLLALGLTEAKIKCKCKNLAEHNYITIGSTKQGMKITEYGKKISE